MNSFSHRFAVLLSLGLLSSGCAPESIEDEALDSPPLQTLDGPDGSHGTNGLPSGIFQARRDVIAAFMNVPLLVNGELNPGFTNYLLDADNKKVFEYAVQCALPIGTFAGDIEGAGLMATAAG